MNADLLPLFPLQVVLFPAMPLPLHIFEPRYKQMIGRCLEEGKEFGVALVRKQGMAAVGCSAEITNLVKKYDDGRLDILTTGRRRFRVGQLVEDLPYLQGRVDFFPAEEPPLEDSASAQRLRELYQQALHLLAGRPPEIKPAAGEFLPSFQVASVLPLELDYKQQLLELPLEAERQASLLQHLESWLAQLQRLQAAKRTAAGNGYAR